MATGWYRCPNCGTASPDCFEEDSAEAPAWEPDQIPCDTCGEHEVVLCPHCHHDFDPFGHDRLPVSPGAPPEPRNTAPPTRHPNTWPPTSWR